MWNSFSRTCLPVQACPRVLYVHMARRASSGGDISDRVSEEEGGWVLCARLEPVRGGVECTGDQKCLCHLESPALVRNVRPLRAQIMYWMRQLYF